jgi:PAS domain S-box-containing protein
MSHNGLTINKLIGILTAAIVLSTASAWMVRRHFINERRVEQSEQISRLARTLNIQLLNRLQNGATAIAGNAQIYRSAAGKTVCDDPATLSVLETIRINFDADIVYVMNSTGQVVACTPYDNDKTLTGNNYAFRPYFTEAMKGKNVLYPAIGETTHRRGLYAGAPIRDPSGNITGVFVIKSGLNLVDRLLASFKFPMALISPNGVVFATNRPEWRFHLLHAPLSPAEQERLRNSRQFDRKPLTEAPDISIVSSTYININGILYSATRVPVGIPDMDSRLWNIISLWDYRTFYPRMLVFSIAAGIAAITIVFSLYLISRSAAKAEQRKADAQLRQEKELTDAILDSVPGMLYLYSEDGHLLRWNRRHEEMTGYSPEELSRMTLLDWYKGDEKSQRAVMEGVKRTMGNGFGETCAEIQKKDGTRMPMYFTASRLTLRGKTCFVGIGIDITDRRQAEAEIQARQRQLEDLNRSLEDRIQKAVDELRQKDQVLMRQSRMAAMGEMIGNIAHQWRQPLNALGLVIANIKDAYDYNELDAEYLSQAVTDSNRLVQKMSSTISDFANFFRPDKKIIPFSGLKQIHDAISLVEASFKNNNIIIHCDTAEDIMLLGFPNEFSQVLLNLLVNAKDAIQASKRMDGLVEVRLTARDGSGCITVRDNGGGIPEAIIGRIFDPYFSTKNRGSGIGLYMSKMIIADNMNGSITARNVEDGAEFTICIPKVPDPA